MSNIWKEWNNENKTCIIIILEWITRILKHSLDNEILTILNKNKSYFNIFYVWCTCVCMCLNLLNKFFKWIISSFIHSWIFKCYKLQGL